MSVGYNRCFFQRTNDQLHQKQESKGRIVNSIVKSIIGSIVRVSSSSGIISRIVYNFIKIIVFETEWECGVLFCWFYSQTLLLWSVCFQDDNRRWLAWMFPGVRVWTRWRMPSTRPFFSITICITADTSEVQFCFTMSRNIVLRTIQLLHITAWHISCSVFLFKASFTGSFVHTLLLHFECWHINLAVFCYYHYFNILLWICVHLF